MLHFIGLRIYEAVRRKVVSWRFALFLLPWLVVLLVPMFRHIFLGQITGNLSDGVGHQLWPMEDRTGLGDEGILTRRRLSGNLPQDLHAKVLATDGDPSLANFDKLIEQYPEETWLISERIIRLNLRHGIKMIPLPTPTPGPAPVPGAPPPGGPPGYGGPAPSAAPGPYSKGYPPQLPTPMPTPTEIPPPEPVPGQRPPENLVAGLKLARLGREREPLNAYYDVVLIEGLLLSRREADAIEVLRQAARKPYFDVHRRDAIRSRLMAYEAVRPLLIEEKMQVLSSRLDFAFSDPMLRRLIWLANQKKRHGNHAQALAIYGDLANLLARVRDNRDGVDKVEGPFDVWRHAVEGTPFDTGTVPRRSAPAVYQRFRARQFAAYANRYNRPDLARTALAEAESTIRVTARRQQNYAAIWGFGLIIPALVQERLLILWMLSIAVGSLILILFAIRWTVYLPLWVPGLQGEMPSRRDLALTAGVYALLTAAAAGIVAWPQRQLLSQSLWLDSTFTIFLGIYPLLLLASPLICAAVTVWHCRSKVFAPREPDRIEFAGMVPRNLLPLFLNVISWTVLITGMACWVAAPIVYLQPNHVVIIPLPPVLVTDPMTTTTTATYDWFVVAGAILSLVSYVGWLIRWRWMAPAELKPISHYAIRWHLKSLGDWIIILSFAYLLVLLSSVPPRREADAALQRFLDQGRTDVPQAAILQQEKKSSTK